MDVADRYRQALKDIETNHPGFSPDKFSDDDWNYLNEELSRPRVDWTKVDEILSRNT